MALSSQDSDEPLLRRASRVLDDYLSLQIVFLGVLFVIAGFAVQFVEASWTVTGVWAVIFALWGVAMILFGLALYGLIWWSHRGVL